MDMLRIYTAKDLARCPLDSWAIPDPGATRYDGEDAAQRDSGEQA